jgi:hypothetical protein
MSRTNATAINEVFDSSLSNTQLETWAEAASDLVDEIAAADGSIADDRLRRIETQLAAHFASSQDQRIASTERASGSVNYQGMTGEDLAGTKYGQTAKLLDPTDTLEHANKPTASLSVPSVR